MKEFFNNIFTVKGILSLIFLSALAVLLFSIFTANYPQKVLRWRKEKDRFFESSNNSPIDLKSDFGGLKYFPPDKNWSKKAKIEILNTQEVVMLWNNDGKKSEHQKYAKLSFNHLDREYVLWAYRNDENVENNEISLFIPFKDLTNGKNTYKSGRYMDIKYKKGQDLINLDFNFAYNPYCAYNARYSCPLTPKNNILPLAVEVGEKNY